MRFGSYPQPGDLLPQRGERIWLEAREDARRRKGDAFDLTEFHRAALDFGLLGLDPLRTALARI